MAEGHAPPCLVLRRGLCKVMGQYLLMGTRLPHPAVPSLAVPSPFMILHFSVEDEDKTVLSGFPMFLSKHGDDNNVA